MSVLLLLAALASPPVVAPSQPAPPAPASAVGPEAPKILPNYIDVRRIQIRPGSKKPGSEGKPGPGIG